MEKKYDKQTVIELNISTLTEILADPTAPAKVRVQASATLLEWVNKQQSSGWDIDL